uniref:Uncharacterized protein n=1 Tax=Staphylothermus marinus TaxID=2280 RepID=A0A7C4D7U8_STAMA
MVRNLALIWILLLLLTSIATVPVLAQNNGSASGEIDEQDEKPIVGFELGNYTREQLIDLAYTVRNVTKPIIDWSLRYNSTLAARIVANGDYFLNLAINETNETLAKTYAFVAAVTYAHSPVTAYQVLAKTIRANESLDWEIRVKKFYNLTVEFRNVTLEVKNKAIEFNITLPPIVDIALVYVEGGLNVSGKLIEQGYYKAAFRTLMRTYHLLVKINAIIVRSVFVVKLNLNVNPERPLGPVLARWRIRKEIMLRVCERLPPAVAEEIKSKIERNEIRNWKEFREEVRKRVEEYRDRVINEVFESVVNIVVAVIRFARFSSDAVNEWLDKNGFLGPGGILNEEALKTYLMNLTREVYEKHGWRNLLENVLLELQVRIRNETGKDVDLIIILRGLTGRSGRGS